MKGVVTDKPYEVGQKVWVYTNYNRSGGPREGTVVKVGRTLVTVRIGTHHEDQFRMETGRQKDGYGTFIRTAEQRDIAERTLAVNERLRALGLEVRHGATLTLQDKERIVEMLTTTQEQQP